MKRIAILILIILLVVLPTTSCGSQVKNETVTIVTTVFPEYDWVKNILGNHTEGIELILLTENGTDLHSFQPTVSDIAKISSCDILICTGGISDTWIDDALKAAPNDERTVIKLMSLLSEDKKLVEQSVHHNTNHDHGHDHNDHHGYDHHEEVYDEHLWLSLKNAKHFCKAITDVLCQKIPEKAAHYTDNCTKYVAKMDKLDSDYAQAVAEADTKNLLFADRFPFSYLTNDYGLTCFAAFPGCSAETEASFETVAFLSNVLNDYSLPAVVILENSEDNLANTVITTAKCKDIRIVSLNSLQSISREDIKNGVTYLDIMKNNLQALCSALNH